MGGFDETFCRTIWSGNGLSVHQICSHYRQSDWIVPFPIVGFGVFLPLAGAFRRKAQGVTQFVDPTIGFFRRDGEEVTVAHPTREPDAASQIHVDLDRFSILDGGDWPSGAHIVDPALGLKHRLLQRDLDRKVEPWLIELRLADLVETTLRRLRGEVRRSSPSTARRHGTLVTEVCEQLSSTLDGTFSLVDLARRVGCSPFHLSRLFKATTGMTMSRYRQARRVDEVLRRIEQGDRNLATIAAETGFTDHSHMTRTVVARLGHCPSQLRDILSRDTPAAADRAGAESVGAASRPPERLRRYRGPSPANRRPASVAGAGRVSAGDRCEGAGGEGVGRWATRSDPRPRARRPGGCGGGRGRPARCNCTTAAATARGLTDFSCSGRRGGLDCHTPWSS